LKVSGISQGSNAMQTAVAFIVFNRPETTRRVFAQIAEAKPAKLLLVADGPRLDRPQESDRCAQVRSIVSRVDWQCEVRQNFSERNLGCKSRLATGLDWVFEQVDEAIIIEDDCLPEPTFFRYASELLERYREDPRIMSISGDNFFRGTYAPDASYYFSRYFHCWGWATWRRAWKLYDVNVSEWDRLECTNWLLERLGGDHAAAEYWSHIFRSMHAQQIDTWDYQFVFASWQNNGLTALPRSNLVTNIGFGADATHTRDVASELAVLPTEPLPFPLRHPTTVERDVYADDWTQRHLFSAAAPPATRKNTRRAVRPLMKRMLSWLRPAA
jgi:hypothetical protein